MAVANVSFLAFLAPILVFFLVAALVSALLIKIEILGKNTWLNVLFGIVVAAIFLSAASLQQYVLAIVPWFATLLIALFFILVLLGLAGKDTDNLKKITGTIFFVAILIVFAISGITIFAQYILPYLPWSSGYGADPNVIGLFSWLYSPRVAGAILLLIAAAAVAWFLAREKGKK